uniref:Orf3 protein n=1 Tax=Kudoa hexapunctata TaxID=1450334 RepID=A0A0H5AY26_9CNID|nr:orf3 protein [Kudoa hexapunctata]BAR94708.1 orf3 protein [Kudoa hexapunctata]
MGKDRVGLVPICALAILSWDVWLLLFCLEVLLFLFLLKYRSLRSLALFLSYGPWLLLSMISNSALSLSWILYWHKALSWICCRWSEAAIGSSKLSFWLSFDASLLILTSSQQIWWSGTYQPVWSYWALMARLLFQHNTAVSLVFVMASGALALEAFSTCPEAFIVLLVWTFLPWIAFIVLEQKASIQPCQLLILTGMVFSPLVLQEYYWLMVVGQSCHLCLWPWSVLFAYLILAKVRPVWHQNGCYFSHQDPVHFIVKIVTFCLFMSSI